MKLTGRRAEAVRFYTGDVRGDDPFSGDPRGYCTLNALLTPGLTTEIARSAEGRRLNPAFLEDVGRTAALCSDLLGAFAPSAAERNTFRVERLPDYRICRDAGRTVSFTSTSADGFLGGYFDKKGLVLLHVRIPAGTPCIAMAEALEHYAKAHEAEILLPPGLALTFTVRPLSGEERKIRDADGNPPVLACDAVVGGAVCLPAPGVLPDRAGADAGLRVFAALNAGRTPDPDDAARFAAWKDAFQAAVLSGTRNPELFRNC